MLARDKTLGARVARARDTGSSHRFRMREVFNPEQRWLEETGNYTSTISTKIGTNHRGEASIALIKKKKRKKEQKKRQVTRFV